MWKLIGRAGRYNIEGLKPDNRTYGTIGLILSRSGTEQLGGEFSGFQVETPPSFLFATINVVNIPSFFPILKGAVRLNDYKRTNNTRTLETKYQTRQSTTVSGIADTADETEARSKHFILYICRPQMHAPYRSIRLRWSLKSTRFQVETRSGRSRPKESKGNPKCRAHILPVGKALRWGKSGDPADHPPHLPIILPDRA